MFNHGANQKVRVSVCANVTEFTIFFENAEYSFQC